MKKYNSGRAWCFRFRDHHQNKSSTSSPQTFLRATPTNVSVRQPLKQTCPQTYRGKELKPVRNYLTRQVQASPVDRAGEDSQKSLYRTLIKASVRGMLRLGTGGDRRGALIIMHSRGRMAMEPAPLLRRDGARRIFTDQADIACTEREAPLDVRRVA